MKNRKRSPLLLKVGIVCLGLAFGIPAYMWAYYATTTLHIGRPYLDWSASRQFSSRAHFLVFYPMFYWEGHYDRTNPGYRLHAWFPR